MGAACRPLTTLPLSVSLATQLAVETPTVALVKLVVEEPAALA